MQSTPSFAVSFERNSVLMERIITAAGRSGYRPRSNVDSPRVRAEFTEHCIKIAKYSLQLRLTELLNELAAGSETEIESTLLAMDNV